MKGDKVLSTKAHNSVVRRGDIGIPLSMLSEQERALLEMSLSLQTKPWDEDEEPQTVRAFHYADGRMWVPRCAPLPTELTPDLDESTEGRPFQFDLTRFKPDPGRGQDKTIPAMSRYFQQHDEAVLVSPTGSGKSAMGLFLAASFGRFIGAPLFVGHQFDNWMDHVHLIGLTPDDVGIVRGDRCDLGKPLTLMSIQSLLARRYPDELYEQIGFLICDEVDHYGAPQWKNSVGQFPARYRLGLSASPRRKDGLTKLIFWAFGGIGHIAARVRPPDADVPEVRMLVWHQDYDYKSFCRWKKVGDRWEAGAPHPTKYDKVLAADAARNHLFAGLIVDAAAAGRYIYVFSRFVDHLETVRMLVEAEAAARGLTFTVSQMRAGMKRGDRLNALQARVTFLTFRMGSDALNDLKRDTEFFLTPPGDPLQPAGRLREKAEGHNRRSLRIIDGRELPRYSKNRAISRKRKYEKLGIKVREVNRWPK